jgi:hypothetical protein
VRYNAAMKLLRRVHLFAGLFMTPWVFLYGVTGFLFNHPDAFPDREVRRTGRAEIAGTELERFPTAAELAEQVVVALNARAGGTAFRLVDGGGAAYSRDLVVTATGHGREHSIRFDPDSGEALIRSTPSSEGSSSSWSAGTSVALADAPGDRLAQGVPRLLSKIGIESDETAVRNPPELICTVEQGGRFWRVAYNIQTGAISARPADGATARLSTRRLLTGMHLAFSYPSRFGVRWFWAVAVDAMFVAMVFWGLSGLLMWWQMKALRRWGIVTLVLSALVAAALGVGMHEVLASRV